MKKEKITKKTISPKKSTKRDESEDLRKPTKLKPLKEKEKKNWKQNLEDDEDDFNLEDDVKFDSGLDEEEDEYFDDGF